MQLLGVVAHRIAFLVLAPIALGAGPSVAGARGAGSSAEPDSLLPLATLLAPATNQVRERLKR